MQLLFYIFISYFSSYTLHVSGLYKAHHQGYLKLWFICYHLVHAVFVDRLCAPANWFVEVALLYFTPPQTSLQAHTDDQ
jgi:hypothetical protein